MRLCNIKEGQRIFSGLNHDVINRQVLRVNRGFRLQSKATVLGAMQRTSILSNVWFEV
jgi:hypothetical protein